MSKFEDLISERPVQTRRSGLDGKKKYYVIRCPECNVDQRFHCEEGTGTGFPATCTNCLHEFSYDDIRQGKLYKYCSQATSEGCDGKGGHILWPGLLERTKYSTHFWNTGGQCRLCKKYAPGVGNDARSRELMIQSREGRVEVEDKPVWKGVLKRFNYCCFNCEQPLTDGKASANIQKAVPDHTFAKCLGYPIGVHGTPLCDDCNQAKKFKWPSEFYLNSDGLPDEDKLKRLAILTGLPYYKLAGTPEQGPVKELLTKRGRAYLRKHQKP
jgi:hypothetical protein